MTTLGDALTPTTLTTEACGVSVKVEQGVLCENSDENGRNAHNNDERDPLLIKSESNQQSDSVNTSNSMCNGDYNNFNPNHNVLQHSYEFKAEPDVDIDDRHPDEEAEELTKFPTHTTTEIPNVVPKITLTPTSKLIAAPNGTIDNKRRYVCPYENCTKSYGKSSHLRSHLTWHTGIKPFVCKEPGCGKGFTRSDELNRHIRTHTGEKPFECVQCSKKFSRSDHLTKHLATHSKQLAGNNSVLAKKLKLEKSFAQVNLKTLPTMGPTDINPNIFDDKFNSPELIISCLKETPVPDSSEVKLEKQENSDCYEMSMPDQQLNDNHCLSLPVQAPESSIGIETDVVVKPEPLDDSQISEFSEGSCPNEPDDDAIMPEANLPPLSQNLSTFTKSATELKQTINNFSDSVYDPTRPFPCCHCAKSFKRQDDLNRHLRTHTGEKPFACNECDKRFMRSDHLKKHMNTHTRVR